MSAVPDCQRQQPLQYSRLVEHASARSRSSWAPSATTKGLVREFFTKVPNIQKKLALRVVSAPD